MLESLRARIRAAAPDAHEKISYQIPTFVLNGKLVHFAAWKTHIGFYPASSGTDAFKDELGQIVKMRVAENVAKRRQTTGHQPMTGDETAMTAPCL
jgi:uncharacterized protein YdhG (YjbR/CyaY superfamily)